MDELMKIYREGCEQAAKIHIASLDPETKAAMLVKANETFVLIVEAFEKVKFSFVAVATQMNEIFEPLRHSWRTRSYSKTNRWNEFHAC